MIYNEQVRGTQAVRPLDFEVNGGSVYARANITAVEETEGDEPFKGWQYSEVELTSQEFDALKMGITSVIPFWNEATRCAERRARYERMDPKVRSLERQIRVAYAEEDVSGAEAAEAKLLQIHQYCKAVTETQNQSGYPQKVTYPDEPDV